MVQLEGVKETGGFANSSLEREKRNRGGLYDWTCRGDLNKPEGKLIAGEASMYWVTVV